MNKEAKAEIANLGEFALIKHLTKDIELINESTIIGVGDDAAVIQNNDLQTVITTDLLVEGIHFDLIYTPMKHLGYKAVMVNISDIYAMNAMPKQIMVSIAISNKISLEMLDEFYSGIKLACKKHKVDIIGGDTSTSLTGFTISITAIGEAKKEDIVKRSTAKINDLICVTGDLGGAYMGLLLMEREKEVFNANPNMQPDFKDNDYVLERLLKPEARGDVIELLKDLKVKPTAMIDISDGLSSEIMHICEMSGVGCRIYDDKIPIDQVTYAVATQFNISAGTAALNGGDDYELLFTVSLSDYEKIKTSMDITIIGNIVEKIEGKNYVNHDGELIELKAQGWKHNN